MDSENTEKTYSDKLGGFVGSLTFADLPGDVVEKTKLHVLDTLGGLLQAMAWSSQK